MWQIIQNGPHTVQKAGPKNRSLRPNDKRQVSPSGNSGSNSSFLDPIHDFGDQPQRVSIHKSKPKCYLQKCNCDGTF